MNYILKNDAQYISALANALPQGGLALGAIFTSKIISMGTRRSIFIFSSVFGLAAHLICQYPYPIWTLLTGRFCIGFYYAIQIVTASLYIRETSPLNLLSTCLNMIGILIAAGILTSFLISFGLSTDVTKNTFYWRIDLGFPMIPVLIQIIFFLFYFRQDTAQEIW